MKQFSTRAEIVAARTYCRPLDEEATKFETWAQVSDRVLSHQQWLWERVLKRPLNSGELAELVALGELMMNRSALPAGRTLWLGGTDLVKRREAANFNCSYLKVETVHDVVDAFWLLLQGCGVGFTPVPGTLNGFMRPIPHVEVIRSNRKTKGGRQGNRETWDPATKTWAISIGDSGEAWAKSIGKLLAGKFPAERLVIEFSEVRPAGTRLAGYGWICSGDSVIAVEYPKIAAILNKRAGRLLTHIDILDILNHLGVIQTGRRGAEIAIYGYQDSGWRDFATAKTDYWTTGNNQRAQSNNSLIFYKKPSLLDLHDVFELMLKSGGSEPGILNGEAAERRAPWVSGVNPCAEILLANKGFCNLVSTDIGAFHDDYSLHRAIRLISRANYRQCLVDLDDGILQRAWHENNQFLRLCGSSLAGIVRRPDLLNPYDLKVLRQHAWQGAMGMADELGTERPKNVTTIKPEGTRAKIADTTEGAHFPRGRYIFNSVTFSRHDPLVRILESSGYRVFDNPLQPDGVVATFPVEWRDVSFPGGGNLNQETALDQLTRYKLLMDNYVDQNASITVSYRPDEIPQIVRWLQDNWDSYVGVSFLPAQDPSKTAEDLGYPYLPQHVVDKFTFDSYASKLKPVDLHTAGSGELLDMGDCEGGQCPIR